MAYFTISRPELTQVREFKHKWQAESLVNEIDNMYTVVIKGKSLKLDRKDWGKDVERPYKLKKIWRFIEIIKDVRERHKLDWGALWRTIMITIMTVLMVILVSYIVI